MQQGTDELNLARLGVCACGNLRMASRAVTQLFDGVFHPTGLRVTQFTLLAAITAFGPTTVTRLSEALLMDRTTLTRNLRPLERRVLIKVEEGEDRRTRQVTITPQGYDAVVQGLPLWEKAQAQVVQGLGEERFHSLLSDLSDLSEVASLA